MRTTVPLVVLACIALSASLTCAQEPVSQAASRPNVKFTISPQTTVISGPVSADGTINYLAALDAELSQGVTLANNAAIPLIRVLGLLDPDLEEVVLKRLEMQPPPMGRDAFVNLDDYAVRQRGPDKDIVEQSRQRSELLDKAIAQPWTAAEFPLVAQWLQANDKALAKVSKASKMSQFYLPLVSTRNPPMVSPILLRSYGPLRHCARALTVRAMLAAGESRTAAALADLLTVHRLARLVAQDCTVIGRGNASALEGMAARADGMLASRGIIPPQACNEHLKNLLVLSPLPPMWQAIDRSERYSALDILMVFARDGVGDFFGSSSPNKPRLLLAGNDFDFDFVLKMINAWFDRVVATHRLSDAGRRRVAIDALAEEHKAQAARTRKEDQKILTEQLMDKDPNASQSLGRIMLGLCGSPLVGATDVQERSAQELELAHLALALEIFKADEGRYPDKLGEVAPRYLPTVPRDRFSSKPLIFEREGTGYTLYSVGINLKDDGGRSEKDASDSPADDIVVHADR